LVFNATVEVFQLYCGVLIQFLLSIINLL
jgi:hypothetical protein